MRALRDGTDEGERFANLQELRWLLNICRHGGHAGGADAACPLLEEVSLVSDVDDFDAESGGDAVDVATAKGLEFPVVFIVGMEDGILPHNRSIEAATKKMDEGGGCAMGIRAKKRLLLR